MAEKIGCVQCGEEKRPLTFPVPKGAPEELQRDFGKWMEGQYKGRIRSDIGKEFFPVVRPWHRAPRAAVAAPSLAVSKARLDGAWSNLGEWKVSLPMAWGGTG